MNRDNIPAELRALAQWVPWNLEPRPGQPKPAKMPYTVTGGHASTTNPATWATFADAVTAAQQRGWSGVGFVFTTDDPYVGLDFDEMNWAQVQPLVADLLPAYVEISQSGNGIHVLCRGKLPPGARRKGKIEAYEEGRFFAITGNPPDGDLPVAALEDRTEALAAFHAAHLGGFVEPGTVTAPAAGLSPDDQAVLDRGLATRQNVALHTLFHSGEADERKQSEARFRLTCLLCQATADDEQVKRLLWASALRNPKWSQHRTLLDIDIRNARVAHPGPVGSSNTAGRWELLTSEQFLAVPEPPWLVQDMLFAGGLTLLYGQKGSYKSFVSYSLAQAIARGQPWLGDRAATKGVVVYVVAEGKGYFGRRIKAAGTPPGIRHATVPVNLFTGEGAEFAACVRAQLGTATPTLFVFDTLARSMVGGEENSNTDMGIVVDAAQRLQLAFNAAVLLVHHTGKDGLSERGGSALRAAADIVLKLEKTGARTVTLYFENTKDTAEPAPQGLVLEEREPSLVVARADVVAKPSGADRYSTQVTAQRRDILDAIGRRELTPDEIARTVDRPAKRVREDLNVLSAGERAPVRVVRGTGRRGSPFVYALRDPDAQGAGVEAAGAQAA